MYAFYFLQIPKSTKVWEEIIKSFNGCCNFPWCGGMLDEKHVILQCPATIGSQYFNYKGTFSIVWLAMANSNLCFQFINLANYGITSDDAIFSHSVLKKAIEWNLLNAPRDLVFLEMIHFHQEFIQWTHIPDRDYW